jgi:5-methylcytosine-specific restriction endonuclease McrA
MTTATPLDRTTLTLELSAEAAAALAALCVVLTTAHLDHDPSNCDPANLRAWCQRCHNTYDAPMRAERRRARKAAGAQS